MEQKKWRHFLNESKKLTEKIDTNKYGEATFDNLVEYIGKAEAYMQEMSELEDVKKSKFFRTFQASLDSLYKADKLLTDFIYKHGAVKVK